MASARLSFLLACVLSATNILARGVPRANQCGVKGYETKIDSYFYDDNGRYAGYAKCSEHCAKDASCLSLAYDNSRVCMHFNVTVAGNFESDHDSTFSFYDRGCVTTSTTISTSKSATTTSVISLSPARIATRSSTLDSSSTSSKTTVSSTKAITSSFSTSTSKATPVSSTNPTSSSTTTKSATSSDSTAVSIPSGCNIPASYKITAFSWFNSTHNLDCATGPDLGDGTGCIKADANGKTIWCDPKTDKSCTNCGIGVCSTGLPPQPLGYGPPDDVKFTFEGGSTCEQLNPALVHRYEVGNGFVNCGSSYDFMNFYGSSNSATSMGTVEINGISTQCSDGDLITPYYNTQFRIDCTYDRQRNATCTTPKAFTIPLIRFTKTKGSS